MSQTLAQLIQGLSVSTSAPAGSLTVDSSGRLLVGTSSARSLVDTSTVQFETVTNDFNNGVSLLNYSLSGFYPVLRLALSRTNTQGGQGTPNIGTGLGSILFTGSDGTTFRDTASITAVADATWGSGDAPGRLVFSTTADGASIPTERMRIGSTGNVDIRHVNNQAIVNIGSTAASGFTEMVLGLLFPGYAPNNTAARFLYCADTAAVRAEIRSNGGLANFQANNVNLSDRNTKKDISTAADTWDCIKDWEIVNYRYKDQPDDADLNLGVIAQQIAESCPEVITIFQEAKEATEERPAQEERLGVKEQQMYWMAIKALQEAIAKIETLQADVALLKGE
jgi:hypothetical protein